MHVDVVDVSLVQLEFAATSRGCNPLVLTLFSSSHDFQTLTVPTVFGVFFPPEINLRNACGEVVLKQAS